MNGKYTIKIIFDVTQLLHLKLQKNAFTTPSHQLNEFIYIRAVYQIRTQFTFKQQSFLIIQPSKYFDTYFREDWIFLIQHHRALFLIQKL